MEEVIGEIKDEFDDTVEVEFKKIDDFNFVFEGKTGWTASRDYRIYSQKRTCGI